MQARLSIVCETDFPYDLSFFIPHILVPASRHHKRTTSLIFPGVKSGAEPAIIHFSVGAPKEKKKKKPTLAICHSLDVHTVPIISISRHVKSRQRCNSNKWIFYINLVLPSLRTNGGLGRFVVVFTWRQKSVLYQ